MGHTSASRSLLGLARRFQALNVVDPVMQCLAPRLGRSFASQVDLPIPDIAKEIHTTSHEAKSAPAPSSASKSLYTLDHPILATHYSWPAIEPSRYALYKPEYLDAPLRKDLLHRAVIYEADMSRQGTASTKWRFDVHGSNRKLYKQKGTGRARVRDKKSPIRRGGGVAFGPKPRDFSTDLPSKIYGQAFRSALSHRFRKNELIILANNIELPPESTTRFLYNFFEARQWGQGNGRSLLVTSLFEKNEPELFGAMKDIGEHGELKDLLDVDVKDLLSFGRVVIEHDALLRLMHRQDPITENETFTPSPFSADDPFYMPSRYRQFVEYLR